MIVQNLSVQRPFVTKDGSTIRSILDRTNAPVQNQSLAEARVSAGGRTERHYNKVTEEELYFILEGAGGIELDGERRMVGPGDAILIPPGAHHKPPWPAVVRECGTREATLSLLLRAALCARGYVFGITGRATVSADSSKKRDTQEKRETRHSTSAFSNASRASA